MTTLEAVSNLRAYADGYAGNIRGMCATAADMLEELDKRAPRWIPVEERLPEAHRHVLVYETNPLGWYNTQIDWMDEQGWVCCVDSEWHTVTHWMPLPKPPEEVQHE